MAWFCWAAHAHTVEWSGNSDGSAPNEPLIMDCDYDEIEIAPSAGELCLVDVNLDPSAGSPFYSVSVLQPHPARSVYIQVHVLKDPPDVIVDTIKGEWHALTGQGPGCDATNAQPFEVPIVIPVAPAPLLASLSMDRRMVTISSAKPFILQASQSPAGPWFDVAQGTSAVLGTDNDGLFFRKRGRIGGHVSGTILDGMGNPQSGVTAGLPGGGSNTQVATDGTFDLSNFPWGNSLFAMMKSFTFVDPTTGANRTERAQIEIEVPVIVPDGFLQFKVEMQVFVSPVCNCTPWCSIGFGTINGSQTPVFYGGGAIPPKGVPAQCDAPQVTVTTPTGATFPIRAGTGRHQNSGPNPASGTWTVTTTVCGQSRSCSITVP